jgi:hypothetical protein
MTNDSRKPTPEKIEPQKISPQTADLGKRSELNVEQLDKVSGGTGGLHGGGPLGPGRGG